MVAEAFFNIAKIPELRKRIVFTLLALGLYRIGVFVPTPGISADAVKKIISSGTVFDIFNMFSGGALENFSVFALGIMPYISSSIIFQLLGVAVPAIERLQKEGELGRKKITQYTRYGTVLLSLIQGFGISYGLRSQGAAFTDIPVWQYYLTTMLTLTAGTCFLMWLGEQITERGIGNGISLIIFGGIVTRIPIGFRDAWGLKEQFGGFFGFLLLLGFIFLVISAIIFFERSHRRIPVQYAKRVIGNKLYGGQATHLPLKINSAGVIPPIFASSLLAFPATIAQFVQTGPLQAISGFLMTSWVHMTLYAGLIIFFAYFYTAVSFNPQDVSENMKKHGGFIPGIRPGKTTAEHIDAILTKITLGGALYLAAICILPEFLTQKMGIPSSLAYTFGGTSLLIAVGVAMDTLSQIEAHLLSRHYEGFLGSKVGGRFRGRRG
ncbi:MAG: preprotein translocase subunit SecY [Deltaproteobacteria bacterium]|nr:preprotein translocase subunit SecY [Deltaproteobacteria bacterium]